jgi:hypothetical protein
MIRSLSPAVVLLAACTSLACSLAPAAADSPGPDWISHEKLVQKLEAAGYQSIVELEADDGEWEGEAIHNGRIVKFKAHPRTGEIVSEKAKR